ncbi:acidic leucine-rich nuclear phosphoprotein 32 family B protein [Parasponia andersonii]|uniref:Acidic leucine-rich nuclear phosphoprotein 32 family B protein n=1 Tax=Parasponia andersonii TaxID=3476 RepID=A0A2P5AHM8_PARAD|nr:acidic leucine-rich nuclear phosphoprotein 32 family B protein [Parasponia andersonii]
MSEFSLSRTKKAGLPSFLLSDLFKFCFFALSHPLYFSYFIFFSPYLFKLLSFLSPLFITTALLLLAFLTTLSPSLVQDDSHSDDLSEPKVGFLASTYQTVLERLRSEADDDGEDFQHFEELDEVYKIVFETSTLEIREDPAEVLEEVVKETCSVAYETPVDKCSIHESSAADIAKEDRYVDFEKDPVEIAQAEIIQPIKGLESLKWCLEEEKELENMSCEKEDKEVKPWTVESEKVDPETKERLFKRSGSKAIGINKIKGVIASSTSDNCFAGPDYDLDQYSMTVNMEESQTLTSNLGSFGSMRKEKEWRRTLACKLFEERHNVDGGEGMDMLWETYETESNKQVQAKSSSKKGKKGVLEYSDDDDDYEDETNGQLCCLQALKFSAGKMNLGMGRPNLVKISKALKGMGWLHHVTRHGKKRYN